MDSTANRTISDALSLTMNHIPVTNIANSMDDRSKKVSSLGETLISISRTNSVLNVNERDSLSSSTASELMQLSSGIEPFLGDSTLNPTTLAALSSIHRTWLEGNQSPLSANKEERIKQAVYFMNSEEHAKSQDKTVKKHSFRQVSLYFKIPKSTLYDRLKYKNIINADSPDITTSNTTAATVVEPESELSPDNTTPLKEPYEEKDNVNNTGLDYNSVDIDLEALRNQQILDVKGNHDCNPKSYRKQMKITPDKEETLINQVRLICHAMGNIMNRAQIKSCIKSYINDIPLGKKWLQNFMNRHKDSVLYGSKLGTLHVTAKNLKNGRNNSAYLWKCFINLIQEQVRQIPNKEPFYYITRTCIHRQSRSSLFTSFKVSPSDYSVKLIDEPKVIIFPEYFNNKMYLHIPEQDYDDNSNINKDKSKDEKANFDLIMKNKNGKLTKMLLDTYNNCFQYSRESEKLHNSITPQVPLVIFEGFDEQFNWDPATCKQITSSSRLISVPWKEHLFQEYIHSELDDKVYKHIDDLSSKSKDCLPLEFALDDVHFDLPLMSQIFNKLMNSKVKDTDSMDIQGVNIENEPYYIKYIQSQREKGFLANNHDYRQKIHEAPIIKKTIEIPSVNESTNIFENNLVSQVNEVVALIEQTEGKVFDSIQDPSSRTLVEDIFSRIKRIIPQ